MTMVPKSPRVGRSPKLKAKWLSNTLAYQYGGNNGKQKSEIIVLCNDIDQYLQDIFQSIDTKARGKITSEEFKLLTDVLYLRDLNDHFDTVGDLSFSEFHGRLCERFASYGDYTGFLVNQNFRTINVDDSGTKNGNGTKTENSASVRRRKEFQRRLANSKTHNCIHDAQIFKNWDKLRLSGLRLSEMREQIDLMQYEVTFHKEEAQSLKEIIEDLRSMLQASDAQNIGLQVALKKCQHKMLGDTDYVYSRSLRRCSLPVDGTKLQYHPLQGEDKSVRILSRELNQLRELRDKEVNELITFNNQLQRDVTDLSREICTLEDENRKLKGQLDLITKTYNSCRELFAVCVESFKEVERANSDVFNGDSVPPSPSPVRTPSLTRKFSFSNSRPRDRPVEIKQPVIESDVHLPPEVVLIKRLEHEIDTLQEVNNAQLQDMARQENDLASCRRHLQTANFQVEALETECGRLLALEDQLVSVFNLLQKGRSQCLSRKTLGQLLLDVIDSSFGEDEQDMTADQFIRMLQQTLSECPLFLFPT